MKRAHSLLVGFAVVLLSGMLLLCHAGTFFDNFDDGNADGWIFPYNSGQTQYPGGSWSVENGTLAQSFFGDGNAGLVNNLVISDQVIEAQVKTTAGYAGLVLWYQQVNSAWANYVAITTGGRVDEYIDGQGSTYQYSFTGFDDTIQRFYDLKVEADRATGTLKVYLDGVYKFTHVVSTPYRMGLSGVYSGNEHGYFDDFQVTANDIPVPNFHADILSGYVPLTVSFTDDSTGLISAWLWNFGDGQTSTGQNPIHTYTIPGTYTVTLTANSIGSSTATKTDYITVAVLNAPDLVGRVKAFGSAQFGGAIATTVQITNIGNRNAGRFSVAMYLSDDGINRQQLLQESQLPLGLKQAAAKEVLLGYNFKSSMSGKYLIVDVDSDGVIAEQDEANNKVIIKIP
jgi:PKD repeat protein